MKAKGSAGARPFADSVFVNCPFDAAYVPLLHALLFTIHDCGFIARLAVEPADANESRLDKLSRLIDASRLSIHDMSRMPGATGDLPRFNMPFECGLAFGAIRYGRKTKPPRDFLFMTAVPYQDKRTISDLAGLDPIAHHDDPRRLVDQVRHFLAGKTDARTRGGKAIHSRYLAFTEALPKLAAAGEFEAGEIETFDYLHDWMLLMTAWLASPAAKR